MRTHPNHTKIHSALLEALAGAAQFRGILYRACDPIYANTRDLLTGEGSQRHGGRWNAPRGAQPCTSRKPSMALSLRRLAFRTFTDSTPPGDCR